MHDVFCVLLKSFINIDIIQDNETKTFSVHDKRWCVWYLYYVRDSNSLPRRIFNDVTVLNRSTI